MWEIEIRISQKNKDKKINIYNIFINNIKNISNSQIQNITIKIPNKIIYDLNGLITFQIESTFKQDNYTKKYIASVEINTNLNFFNISDEIEVENETLNNDYFNNFIDKYDKNINYEKEKNLEYENQIKEIPNINNYSINNNYNDEIDNNDEYNIKIKNINPSSIVKVYDYKEK